MAGPPPHGKALGLAKCIGKEESEDKILVHFQWTDDDGRPFCRAMSPEDAKYWKVDVTYNILGTQP